MREQCRIRYGSTFSVRRETRGGALLIAASVVLVLAAAGLWASGRSSKDAMNGAVRVGG